MSALPFFIFSHWQAVQEPNGFAENARDFAFGKRDLKLIDGEELVERVYKYYDRLDGKYKGLIPLRRVLIPETLTQS